MSKHRRTEVMKIYTLKQKEQKFAEQSVLKKDIVEQAKKLLPHPSSYWCVEEH